MHRDRLADCDEAFSKLYQGAPPNVRAEIDGFIFGIASTSRMSRRRVEDWRLRLLNRLDGLPIDESNAGAALDVVKQLKIEYVALVVSRQQYLVLLFYWLATAMMCLFVQLSFGEDGFMKLASESGIIAAGAIYGHFNGYISFKYCLYGIILGNALLLSYRRSIPSFYDPSKQQPLVERPLLNLIIGGTLAYVVCRLIAEGKVSANLFGVEFKRTNGFGFHDSGALFLVGLAACIAADVYLQRLIGAVRDAAAKAFGIEVSNKNV